MGVFLHLYSLLLAEQAPTEAQAQKTVQIVSLQNTIENNNFARPIKKDNNVEIDRENVKNDSRGVQGVGFTGSQDGYIEKAKESITRGSERDNQTQQSISNESEIDANRKRQEAIIEEL